RGWRQAGGQQPPRGRPDLDGGIPAGLALLAARGRRPLAVADRQRGAARDAGAGDGGEAGASGSAILKGMKADAEKLLEEALKLPAESRAEMAGRLLRSLEDDEEPSPEQYGQAWGDEIARRIREVEDG